MDSRNTFDEFVRLNEKTLEFVRRLNYREQIPQEELEAAAAEWAALRADNATRPGEEEAAVAQAGEL